MSRSLRLLICVLLTTVGLVGCDAIEEMQAPSGSASNPTPVQRVVGNPAKTVRDPGRDYIREMLLDDPQGEWPDPLPALTWLETLEDGWRETAKDGRPLLVLVRCPVSTRSGTLDEEFLNPPPELGELLRQFVTVVLTDAHELDLTRLPLEKYQDPDQTWWCWVLSPDAQVYSVLGKESPEAPDLDRDDLTSWLTTILDHHWDPRRKDWNADGPVIPTAEQKKFPNQLSGYAKWKGHADSLGNLRNDGQCICCHQAQDLIWMEKSLSTGFRPNTDYWLWPPMRLIGLTLNREGNPSVERVETPSMSASADIQIGDKIGLLGNKRIFSATDVRAAFQELEPVQMHAVRNGENVVSPKLPESPRKRNGFDVTWRRSILESVLGSHPGFLPVVASDASRNKLNLDGKMCLGVKVGTGSPAWEAGVRPEQIIVRFGDLDEDLSPNQLLVAFRVSVPVGSKGRFSARYPNAPQRVEALFVPAISVLDLPPEAIEMMKEPDNSE